MPPDYYKPCGSYISPGDIFEDLPYIRVSSPTRVARKVSFSLPPKKYSILGELREILEVGKHEPKIPFNFEASGEEILATGRVSRVIFLTWGSEVESDERDGNLHRKDWLVAPIFSITELDKHFVSSSREITMGQAIRSGKSPKFFPLLPFPDSDGTEYYVDFRKICALSADRFRQSARKWRLGDAALNGFYHQLLWFFTRKKLFFGPIECQNCGTSVDLNVVFEGQEIDPPGN